MGGVEPWLMARWKARVRLLFVIIELFSLAHTVEALQGNRPRGQVKETVVSRSSRYSGHDGRVRCICYYETRPSCP